MCTTLRAIEEREDGVATAQYVWSPVDVDAMILRDRDANANPADGLEQRHYVQHDANFNVTAITDPTGTVVERYLYDPYGQATVLAANWQPTTGNHDWQHLHQGGRYDPATALHHFRNRDYSAELGRWVQQDPLGYVDGLSLMEYVQSAPIELRDAMGLQTGVVMGPEAGVVSYIAPMDMADQNLVLDVIAEYQKATGRILRAGRAKLLHTGLHELNMSSNTPLPPAALNTPAAKNLFKATKEYRGYTFMRPAICCFGGNVRAVVPAADSSQGFTPVRMGMPTIYAPGQGFTADTVGQLGQPCITITRMNDFRIGQLGQLVAQVFNGVPGAPFVWHSIRYTICCNGTTDIQFQASHFPSHDVYVNGLKVRTHTQKNLAKMMFAGNGVGAPGGAI